MNEIDFSLSDLFLVVFIMMLSIRLVARIIGYIIFLVKKESHSESADDWLADFSEAMGYCFLISVTFGITAMISYDAGNPLYKELENKKSFRTSFRYVKIVDKYRKL